MEELFAGVFSTKAVEAKRRELISESSRRCPDAKTNGKGRF